MTAEAKQSSPNIKTIPRAKPTPNRRHKHLTVRQLVEGYLDSRTDLEAETLYSYRKRLERYIYPRLGDVSIHKLTAPQIQEAYTDIVKNGGSGSKPLSSRTLKNAHTPFNSALRRAEKQRIISYNPASGIELPRYTPVRAQALELSEMRRLLLAIEALEDSDIRMALLIAVFTGLRRAEICGLTWGAIDLHRSMLSVRQSFKCITGEEARYGKLKTRSSERNMYMSADLVSALRQHKEDQYHTLRKVGIVQASDTAVVLWRNSPMPPNSLTKQVRNLFDEIGLLDFGIHSLRHTQATYLLLNNVPVNVVQERLGHASATTTLDVYGHVIAGQDEIAAETFQDVIHSIQKVNARRRKRGTGPKTEILE